MLCAHKTYICRSGFAVITPRDDHKPSFLLCVNSIHIQYTEAKKKHNRTTVAHTSARQRRASCVSVCLLFDDMRTPSLCWLIVHTQRGWSVVALYRLNANENPHAPNLHKYCSASADSGVQNPYALSLRLSSCGTLAVRK